MKLPANELAALLVATSFAAGLNLYATIATLGLLSHFGFVHLPPTLQLLSTWTVIVVSFALFAVEFFADKVPWLDSAWDAVHTVIRPIGGALLAIQVFGHPSPAFTVIVALLAGSTSLLVHTAKAATRLTANASPEPFSNIGLSLGEDAAVLGGLALVHLNRGNGIFMAKRRGNPNWGKPEPIGPITPTVTEFEQVVREYKLAPDQYLRSTRLREWARRNKNSKYIPEPLLEAWGFEIESTL